MRFRYLLRKSPFSLSSRRNYGRIREELHASLDLKTLLSKMDVHMRNGTARRAPADWTRIEALYTEYRRLTTLVSTLKRERKVLASKFIRASEVPEVVESIDDAYTLKEKIEETMNELKAVEELLGEETLLIPNETHPSSPVGGPECNQLVEIFGGDSKQSELSHPLDHLELGKRLDIIDFEAGARVSGSGFYFMKNQGALLENALVQYALSMAIKAGFSPVLPPDIVNSKFIRACGFFPRSEESNKILPVYTAGVDGEQNDESPMKVLAATGEIPLAAYHSEHILPVTELPIKWVAVSHCFRPETGHHGSESRGLYRVHQFTKVELFVIKDNKLSSSEDMLQKIVALQKSILTGLGLKCRLLNMATEELGASAYQKYDIETYLPLRLGWGEVTSASNCTDYQSRRLQIKYRVGNEPSQFVHTLNGTALAVPRIIQAILENYQQADGSVFIPKVLHEFMLDGSTIISPK